jgi:predicted transcriptional regulator
MTGFGRLFADDTCIGHMAHNEENLHTLISTDLEYLNAWSYTLFNLYLSFRNMLSSLEVLSISTSVCFVHLQSLLKITPKCLCICTGDSEILLKSNNDLNTG